MSGMVIAFPGIRVDAHGGPRTKRASSRSRKLRPQIKARVERITALLAELEGIPSPSGEVVTMLTRARASMRKVEDRLRARSFGHPLPPPVVEDEGDPQPDVDREALERHFRPLDLPAMTEKRSGPGRRGSVPATSSSRIGSTVELAESATDLRETARRIRTIASIETGEERSRLLAYADEVDRSAAAQE